MTFILLAFYNTTVLSLISDGQLSPSFPLFTIVHVVCKHLLLGLSLVEMVKILFSLAFMANNFEISYHYIDVMHFSKRVVAIIHN